MNKGREKEDGQEMVAAVDVGNSSINIGFFSDARLLVLRLDTHPLRKSGEYVLEIRNFLRRHNSEKREIGVIISSVVRTHTPVFEDVFAGFSGRSERRNVLTVSHEMKSGLKFAIPSPGALGTDRLAGAVAAFEAYGGPVAVVDCGTATTISAIDASANFIGGAIMPGMRLMNSSLAEGASCLPCLDLKAPGSALGKDTAGCISSGLFFGTAGAVERILSEIEKEKGFSFNVVITGGHGKALEAFFRKPHRHDQDLVLRGLKILYDRNRS